jgi:hypothetical protein
MLLTQKASIEAVRSMAYLLAESMDLDAAQYMLDARITPIYEGTNGIQAIDLVTRKLTIRGGGAMSDLLASIEALDEVLAKAGPDVASIRSNLAAGVTALRHATDWIVAAEPVHALAGASDVVGLAADQF